MLRELAGVADFIREPKCRLTGKVWHYFPSGGRNQASI
jgi:hypothetical protein